MQSKLMLAAHFVAEQSLTSSSPAVCSLSLSYSSFNYWLPLCQTRDRQNNNCRQHFSIFSVY